MQAHREADVMLVPDAELSVHATLVSVENAFTYIDPPELVTIFVV